jgi:hypothetical protein
MNIETTQVALLKKDLLNEERLQFDVQFANKWKNPTTAFLLSLFLSGVGVDRLYIGDFATGGLKLFAVIIGLAINQMAKFATDSSGPSELMGLVGGLICLLPAIDWFLIVKATRTHNIQVAKEIQASLVQLRPSN